MNDYIKREDAYNTLTDYYHHRTDLQHDALRDALSRTPTADVRENVKGEWIRVKDDVSFHYECSVCRAKPLYEEFCDLPELSNFCPNCGADLRGGQS